MQQLREVILDTETTGLDPKNGHRIVEIGAIEMVNKVLTGKYFHFYCPTLGEKPRTCSASFQHKF